MLYHSFKCDTLLLLLLSGIYGYNVGKQIMLLYASNYAILASRRETLQLSDYLFQCKVTINFLYLR